MFFSVAYYKGRAEVQFYLRSFSRELGEQIFFFFFPSCIFCPRAEITRKLMKKTVWWVSGTTLRQPEVFRRKFAALEDFFHI